MSNFYVFEIPENFKLTEGEKDLLNKEDIEGLKQLKTIGQLSSLEIEDLHKLDTILVNNDLDRGDFSTMEGGEEIFINITKWRKSDYEYHTRRVSK